jgi:hypothetical protein
VLQKQPLDEEQVLELLELQEEPRKDQIDVGIRVEDLRGVVGERRGELLDGLKLPLLEVSVSI